MYYFKEQMIIQFQFEVFIGFSLCLPAGEKREAGVEQEATDPLHCGEGRTLMAVQTAQTLKKQFNYN